MANNEIELSKSKKSFSSAEDAKRRSFSGVCCLRFVKRNRKRVKLYADAIKLFGLPYSGQKSGNPVNIEVLETPDFSDTGYGIYAYLGYHDNMKNIPNFFPIFPRKQKSRRNIHQRFVINIKTENYEPQKTLYCDWNDGNDHFTLYGNLNFFVGHGLKNAKTNRNKSFRQILLFKEQQS